MRKQNCTRVLHIGLDIGSTTIKTVVLDGDEVVYQTYERHHSDIHQALTDSFSALYQHFFEKANSTEQSVSSQTFKLLITGSGGMKVAERLNVPFIQEVIAQTEFVTRYYPEADIIVELGGEDAKITFLKPQIEQRMNGVCAGGTGSFIDQMAQLMNTDAQGLNELAKNYSAIYPIASRCGVFAKSDVQPLLNEGASHEDIAASVLQAVVNQSITALAQGRAIKGHVVFLGGPLFFLSELREAFRRTLGEAAASLIVPEDAQVVVAKAAAMLAGDCRVFTLDEMQERLREAEGFSEGVSHVPPLFANPAEKQAFLDHHAQATIPVHPIWDLKGPAFLGIDAGSTTTKAVLLDGKGEIYYSSYGSNLGNPVASGIGIIKELYRQLPPGAYIARSCVSGYGEALIKAALKVDEGEIETIAHYRGAKFFREDVDFIVDIGGQDMKCMQIEDGVICNIMLNEACSSGCGSFVQTFAHSLDMSVPEFAQAALDAERPVDLGTRCTVFMNSRVKQAQKEGASIGDISAGLAYSVVRNALYKVIKIQDPDRLGQNIVVQGGTFLNDSVLRCFELIMGKEVIRPNIAGLMGAFGAALTARAHYEDGAVSTLLSAQALDDFTMENSSIVCRGCGNNCRLTISTFNDSTRFISGNRCERGAGKTEAPSPALPNLYAYKYKRLFAHYEPLPASKSIATIGIPRALNMYEDYPFWFTFFYELGFRVELSKDSSHDLYTQGMGSIVSDSICYPAKLVSGHIEDLISRGIRTIFYPSVIHEFRENLESDNHYNCPIVISYPEVIANNVDSLESEDVCYLNPFVQIADRESLVNTMTRELEAYGLHKKDIRSAADKAYAEYLAYKEDVLRAGDEARAYISEHQIKGIVLAGRPYHIDPEINHGIPELINGLGVAVLSEDSIARPGTLERPIRVVDQWTYHSRLYEAAAVVTEEGDLELVQLNSFGCGLDAVTTDQVKDILCAKGKIYTCLKIDEISNLGAVRIRLRSLLAAMQERKNKALPQAAYVQDRVTFTKEMAQGYTILAPQMAPTHFAMVEAALKPSKLTLEILPKVSKEDIECGLKYVHNDACYPAIIIIGQLINALKSGRYDLQKTAVIMSQTGGGCRATNYTAFLRKALKDADLSYVPAISVSVQGIETNPRELLDLPALDRIVKAAVVGDLLDRLTVRVRPYETEAGLADALYHKWLYKTQDWLSGESRNYKYRTLIKEMIKEFEGFELRAIPRKPRVGIVGEILVKFHPDANNNVVKVIEKEGCEAVVPNLVDFFLYCAYNGIWRAQELGGSKLTAILSRAAINIIERYRRIVRKLLSESKRFQPLSSIEQLAEGAKDILQLGHSCGEGWFLSAEMIDLIKGGAGNIICAQPFACLPNHVIGKGMIKKVRQQYPEANIVPVDYDPGASEVNQLNRIKLMIAQALKSTEYADGQIADGQI